MCREPALREFGFDIREDALESTPPPTHTQTHTPPGGDLRAREGPLFRKEHFSGLYQFQVYNWSSDLGHISRTSLHLF